MDSPYRLSLQIALALGICLLLPFPASAYTPESKEVRAMITHGLKFMEKDEDSRLGAKCLVGLCFYKDNQKDHPKIKVAVDACKSFNSQGDSEIYNLAIAIMFLCEVEPDEERKLIEDMLKSLLARQKKEGGWGYSDRTTGDTSQTQFAVLAIWMAEGIGVDIPLSAKENVANWLLRTQDPAGGWGYQGKDSGSYKRIPQEEIQGSLTSAGLGSAYIIADVLRLTTPKEPEPDRSKALTIVRKDQARRKPLTNRVDQNVMLQSLADGDRWFLSQLDHAKIAWFYYYLYALERYQSFKDLANGVIEKEPNWYTAYVKMLQAKMDTKNGGWEAGPEGKVASTALAVLFLLRSSQKAIKQVVSLGDGVMLGGMGLPPSVADIKEKDGKVVETPLSGSIDELLAVLEDDSNPELKALADSDKPLELSEDVTKRAGQIVKLRALVSAPTFEARLVAVRSLGKTGNPDNVPLLLYALTDPDLRVVRESDKWLRFISRKFEGFGFPEGPEPAPSELQRLRSNWKKWYLSVCPDAELLD